MVRLLAVTVIRFLATGEVSNYTDNTMFAILYSRSLPVLSLMLWCTSIRSWLLNRWLHLFLMQTFLQEPRVLPQNLTLIVFDMTDLYEPLWRHNVSYAPSMWFLCDLWLHIFGRIILDRCKRPLHLVFKEPNNIQGICHHAVSATWNFDRRIYALSLHRLL